MNKDEIDLISKLLAVNPKQRLGHGSNDTMILRLILILKMLIGINI